MTATALDSERTNRRSVVTLAAVAGIVFGLSWPLGRPDLGAIGFGALMLAAAVVQYRHPGPLFDERDQQVQNQASAYTLAVVGVLSGITFPAIGVLYATGRFEWTAASSALALGVAALYLLYGVVTVVVSWRH